MTGSSRARWWSSSATSSTNPWWWCSRRRRAPVGSVRYRLLETLRQYALERLTAEDALAAAARRHARYFLDLVERADARLWAGDEAGAMGTIEPEHDNVRAALRHFLATGDAECAARLAERDVHVLVLSWLLRRGTRLAA